MDKTFIFWSAIKIELLSKNDLKQSYLKIVNVDKELLSSMFCGLHIITGSRATNL